MVKPASTIERKVGTATISKVMPRCYERITGRSLQRIRKRIALRDEYTCRACGRVTYDFEIDHIVPLFEGGAESDINRQLLCLDCHKVKSDAEDMRRQKQ